MKKILKAFLFLVIVIIIGGASDYLHYSGLEAIMKVVLFIAEIYFLYALISTIWIRIKSKSNATSTKINNLSANIKSAPIPRQPVKRDNRGWIIFLIIFIVLILILKTTLGYYGAMFFVFLDNLIKLGNYSNPIFNWVFTGLLTGIVYGCVTAWKKYKLNALIGWASIGAFILLLILFFLVNEPSNAFTYQ